SLLAALLIILYTENNVFASSPQQKTISQKGLICLAQEEEPMNKDNALVRLNNTANTESVGYVRRFVKKLLNNDQFDALVIFAYNYPVGVKCVADYINTKGF
ncbi:37747_t:CDS:2, partial [Gigaspora margarita]